MNKTQTAKFASYNRIVAFLLAYAIPFTGLVRLIKSGTDFKAAFTALKLLLPTSTAIKSSPVTIHKNKDFSDMIDLMVSLSNRAYLFAVDTASETLESIFKVERNSFITVSQAEQVLLAQNILLSLNGNSAALILGYDITAAELTAAAADIIICQDQIAAPSTIIGNNKTFNDEIIAAFLLVDEKVELLGKAILGKFKTGPSKNTSLISNFEKARKTIESTKHTALDTTITDIDGNPIDKALVQIAFEEEIREATSNIEGFAEVEEFIGGTYHVTYSAPDYITQIIPTKFILGETTTTAIVLLKIV